MDVELELEVAALGMGGALLAGLFDEGGVAGVLGEGDGTVGQDAEGERSDGGEGEADGRRNADGTKLGEAGALRAGPGVDGGQQAQVVEAGDAAVEQADDSEPDVASVDGGGEDVELAEEAAGEGDSDERKQEEAEESGEPGALLA
jgi:hypothetical protein